MCCVRACVCVCVQSVRAELTDKEEPDVTGLEALFEGYREGHFMPGSDKNSSAIPTSSTSNGKVTRVGKGLFA